MTIGIVEVAWRAAQAQSPLNATITSTLSATRSAAFADGNAGSPLAKRASIVNAHTGETFDGAYRDDQGPIKTAIDELCILLRDHYSGQTTQIDVGVIDFLADVLDAVGETKATILSAYRTAATNAMLARTTFGVAEHSQHILGRALDIRVGSRLSDAMTRARAMQRGGVGWYPHSGFIHIDTGPVRNWTLDENGLDNLLIFDGRQLRLDGTSQALMSESWRPFTVTQRITFEPQLARAEFLARKRGFRLNP
jgi:uncharacterized protein YcbK (DUF882 family)